MVREVKDRVQAIVGVPKHNVEGRLLGVDEEEVCVEVAIADVSVRHGDLAGAVLDTKLKFSSV